MSVKALSRGLGVLVLLALLGVGAGCAGTSSAEGPATVTKPQVASSSATTGTLDYALSVTPIAASVGETVTATVTYRNFSEDTTMSVVAPGGAAYNIRVVSSDGKAVFDSFKNSGGAIPRMQYTIVLAPGGSESSDIEFALPEAGTYSVTAFMMTTPSLETPPVEVTAEE